MARASSEIPTAHVDDEAATAALTDRLREIHGDPYAFAVDRWRERTVLEPDETRVSYHVVIEAEDCSVPVEPGDTVHGPPPDGPYREGDGPFPRATEPHAVEIRPGDVIALAPGDDPVALAGAGSRFVVRTERTPYPAARVNLLRNVPDDAAGCAEYESAFRREVLPPVPSDDADDARGVNRINQHTIDMRHDRDPPPVQHCHAPVSAGDGRRVAHTETAIVLDRSTYDLPPVEASDPHVRIFRRPHEDASDWFDLPVEPGSIVVTPATDDRVYGHAFRNAFAILVAVPSFTAPLTEIGADRDRAGETHRKYHT